VVPGIISEVSDPDSFSAEKFKFVCRPIHPLSRPYCLDPFNWYQSRLSLQTLKPCKDMASGDDKQEEEEFEDLPSEVEGDTSEIGNTSA
jgi:hypothetical protein